MLNFQEELDLSPHSCLYDILVKEDHLLRKLNNLVDFSFIIEEVRENYCLNDGRNAVDPITYLIVIWFRAHSRTYRLSIFWA